MITYECPFSEIQEAAYKLLTDVIEGYDIFDDSTPIPELENRFQDLGDTRFVLIRDVAGYPSITKHDTLIWDVTVQFIAMSSYKGKKYLNEMVNDICVALTNCKLPFKEESNFVALTSGIDSVTISSQSSNNSFTWHAAYVDATFKVESVKY